MTSQNDSWKEKWTFLIDRMKRLIATEGKKMVLINIDAMENPKEQFAKYMETCEKVKNQFEVVVSTGLPGEERVFWPYKDVQFYIRIGEEKISDTGNPKAVQEVLNISDEPVDTSVPEVNFWKYDNFNYHLDSFSYVDESKLFDKDFSLNISELRDKYQYQQTREFENKKYWYLLKFLFIGSYFQNLEGFGDLLGGVPKGLKIKCNCGDIVDPRWNLKGILEFPQYDYKQEYYLSVSEMCENCGTITCVYRDRSLNIEDYFIPLRIFMNFLAPNWNYDLGSVDMVSGWSEILQEALFKDRERVHQLYTQDLLKFGLYIAKMKKKFNKKD